MKLELECNSLLLGVELQSSNPELDFADVLCSDKYSLFESRLRILASFGFSRESFRFLQELDFDCLFCKSEVLCAALLDD